MIIDSTISKRFASQHERNVTPFPTFLPGITFSKSFCPAAANITNLTRWRFMFYVNEHHDYDTDTQHLIINHIHIGAYRLTMYTHKQRLQFIQKRSTHPLKIFRFNLFVSINCLFASSISCTPYILTSIMLKIRSLFLLKKMQWSRLDSKRNGEGNFVIIIFGIRASNRVCKFETSFKKRLVDDLSETGFKQTRNYCPFCSRGSCHLFTGSSIRIIFHKLKCYIERQFYMYILNNVAQTFSNLKYFIHMDTNCKAFCTIMWVFFQNWATFNNLNTWCWKTFCLKTPKKYMSWLLP